MGNKRNRNKPEKKSHSHAAGLHAPVTVEPEPPFEAPNRDDAWIKNPWEEWDTKTKGEFFFTPLLNAALNEAMTDRRYSDSTRVHLCVIRRAAGNWCPYAINLSGMELAPITPADGRWIKELLFGVGPCLLCGEAAGRQKLLPRGLRWHRGCLIVAYARDAARLGNSEQREWAAKVIAELNA